MNKFLLSFLMAAMVNNNAIVGGLIKPNFLVDGLNIVEDLEIEETEDEVEAETAEEETEEETEDETTEEDNDETVEETEEETEDETTEEDNDETVDDKTDVKEEVKRPLRHEYVDENGDGICDKCPNEKYSQRHECFKDENKDGECDNQENDCVDPDFSVEYNGNIFDFKVHYKGHEHGRFGQGYIRVSHKGHFGRK